MSETRRAKLIDRAKVEFIDTGKTKNITDAVTMFWQAHPEECANIPEIINKKMKFETNISNIPDEYERPKCRKCGSPLFWAGGCSACKGKKNQWVCKKCGFKHITKNTLEEAISKLKKR